MPPPTRVDKIPKHGIIKDDPDQWFSKEILFKVMGFYFIYSDFTDFRIILMKLLENGKILMMKFGLK